MNEGTARPEDRLPYWQKQGEEPAEDRAVSEAAVQITPGNLSGSLLGVLNDGLVSGTWSTLRRAIQEHMPTSAVARLMDEQKNEQKIKIEVLPIEGATMQPRGFLVLYQNLGNGEPSPSQGPAPPQQHTAEEKDRLSAQPNQNLDSSRFHLQSLVEERDFEKQVEAKDYADSLVESVPVPIVVLNEDCSIRTHNTAFRELTRLKAAELTGRSLPDLGRRLWGLKGLGERIHELLMRPIGSMMEFEHDSKTAKGKNLTINGRTLPADGGRVVLLTMEDITIRRRAEKVVSRRTEDLQDEVDIVAKDLARTQGELRGLNAHLFAVQEAERQHVARELHDDISQRLSLLEMLLHEVNLDHATAENRSKIERAQQQIESINTDVRLISHRLHPAILNDLGLSAALKALVTEFGERENMPATYVTQNLPESWSPEAATALYRIAQEALRNVSKHAGKTHVKVILAGEGECLQLRVMDFGIGFDQEMDSDPGLGMISMQERARLAGGTMTVTSKLGEGTTVTVDVPVKQHE